MKHSLPRLGLVLFAAAASACSLDAASSPAARARPNIVIVSVDDQNDWVGPLGGYPNPRTPNWDRLAKMAQTFTNAHAATPLCNPCRTSILWGLRPSTTGIYTNKQPPEGSPVLKNALSMVEDLHQQGYKTMMRGKVFHGGPAAMWDYHYARDEELGPPKSKRPINGWDSSHDWLPLDATREQMPDWKNMEWAAQELKKHHEKPFLISVGTVKPHLPWDVPKQYYDLHPLDQIVLPEVRDDDLNDVPPAAAANRQRKTFDRRKAVQAYLASMSFADDCLGHLLDALEESPNRENTIVVVFGDNGFHLGQKGRWGKMTPWEESTHVPFMWVVPGITKAGSRCDAPVLLMDIYATLVDVCGLEPRPKIESVSLAPLLKNPKAEWNRPAVTTVNPGNHSIRTREWRYIRYADGTEELYNERNDPHEWTNVAADQRYAGIKGELAKWLPAVNAESAPMIKGRGGDEDEDEGDATGAPRVRRKGGKAKDENGAPRRKRGGNTTKKDEM